MKGSISLVESVLAVLVAAIFGWVVSGIPDGEGSWISAATSAGLIAVFIVLDFLAGIYARSQFRYRRLMKNARLAAGIKDEPVEMAEMPKPPALKQPIDISFPSRRHRRCFGRTLGVDRSGRVRVLVTHRADPNWRAQRFARPRVVRRSPRAIETHDCLLIEGQLCPN
ncbi:MAG TPA: hypothetical protein P5328_01745 [Candidatus Paceibacterota bacterium]|nr:hypothetical protein [Candidatus Paceibacterota bacterium]HRZ34644.1 hypothetical protein [Candidatus Paceibacterota bacterium]